MADYRVVQKQAASLTYVGDCATRLAKAYPAAPVTIASATGNGTYSGVVVSAVSGSGTTFTFHAATSGATPNTSPEPLATINLTLSNGDVDPIEVTIAVTT